MALKAQDQIKTVFGTSPLQLKADPGESLLVKAIRIYSPDAKWATLKTEKTTVGYFSIEAGNKNHLFFPILKNVADALQPQAYQNLLDFLLEKGIFKGYPVAEGETFLPQTDIPDRADIKSITYDVYDAEDQKNTNPNGSKATEYMLINYGDTGAAISASGDFIYNTPKNPVEFPAFPFAADVPAKHQITIHGILGEEVGVVNSEPALAIYTKYIKLIKAREVLFDEDRNGIPFSCHFSTATAGTHKGTGWSPIGPLYDINPRPPLMFTQPLVFDPGDELNLYVTVEEYIDGSQIDQTWQLIGLIETITRITG